jgi:hypothetical protein
MIYDMVCQRFLIYSLQPHHSTGVTDLLLGALGFHDDIGTVQKALRCLAIMDFEVIRADLYQPLHIRRIFGHNTTRAEWYFPSLTLICAVRNRNFQYLVECVLEIIHNC